MKRKDNGIFLNPKKRLKDFKRIYFFFFLQQDFFCALSKESLGKRPTQYLGELSSDFCLQQDFFLIQVVVVSLGLFSDNRVRSKRVFIIIFYNM